MGIHLPSQILIGGMRKNSGVRGIKKIFYPIQKKVVLILPIRLIILVLGIILITIKIQVG